MKGSWFRRYLMVLAVILAAIVAGGIWLKPSLERMRETVDAGLSEYARAKTEAGETVPAVTHQESRDWLIAVSHTATVGEKTFYCVGAFKVTYCDIP